MSKNQTNKMLQELFSLEMRSIEFDTEETRQVISEFSKEFGSGCGAILTCKGHCE